MSRACAFGHIHKDSLIARLGMSNTYSKQINARCCGIHEVLCSERVTIRRLRCKVESIHLISSKIQQSYKMVEIRITKFLQYGSPMTLVFLRGKFHPEILRGSLRVEASNKGGVGKISSFLSLSWWAVGLPGSPLPYLLTVFALLYFVQCTVIDWLIVQRASVTQSGRWAGPVTSLQVSVLARMEWQVSRAIAAARLINRASHLSHRASVSVNRSIILDAYLTLWRPLLPYGYSYKKASCVRPG